MSNFVDAPAYTEAGRNVIARQRLKTKLELRAAEENPAEDSADEVENAKLAAAAVEDIEAKMSDPAAQKPPQVVMGQQSVVSTSGSLTPAENARLQAMCCAGKAGKVKAFANVTGESRILTSGDIESDAVLVFSGCKQCEYTVEALCTKIFVESCEDLVLKLVGKVVTQTVECNRLERCNILVGTKIGTMQVEQSTKVNVVYDRPELFGWVIWAGSFLLRLQVGEDHLMRCDFGLTKQFDQTVHKERTQFKVWFGPTGKLLCDKIVRLKNGFPTTKREDDEFERVQESNMEGMAKRMGITISRKAVVKVKPNDPCPCGSGKKHKKCCRT